MHRLHALRPLAAVSLFLLSIGSCVGEGVGPHGAVPTAPIALAPQLTDAAAAALAEVGVDMIRLTARASETGTVLAREEVPVDPSAAAWDVSIDVPVAEGPLSVLVEIELISGGVVEFSGVAGPFVVSAGAPASPPTEVPVFRGPLSNLSVTGLQITGAPAALAVGSSVDLDVDVQTAPGTTEPPTVFWESDDDGVAVVDANGVVTGVAGGVARIVARAGRASDAVEFPVLDEVAGIRITPETASFDALGGEALFEATVLSEGGGVIEGIGVTWDSSDPAVLTLLEPGRFLVTGNGDAVVSAHVEGEPELVATATVAVRQVVTDVVAVPPSVSLVALGQEQAVEATALDANGTPVEGAALTWTTADPEVATVTQEGVVRAVGAGETVVEVTGIEPGAGAPGLGSARAIATTQIVVEVTVERTGLLVRPTSGTLSGPGQTLQFTAVFAEVDGSETPVEGAEWSSSNTSVATVDANGLARSVGTGTTTIAASAQGLVGRATLTVAGADLFVPELVVTPDQSDGSIGDIEAVVIDVVIENRGTRTAGANVGALRILDAETGALLSTETGPIPELAPGETYQASISPSPEGPEPAVPPTAIRFEVIADFENDVPESDEFNNSRVSQPFPVTDLPTGPGIPDGFDAAWIGEGGSVDWLEPANWASGIVPSDGYRVYVGNGPFLPTIDVVLDTVRLARLTVEDGVTLTNHGELLISETLEAGQTIVGNGDVVLDGPGTVQLSGVIEQYVLVRGDAAAAGPLVVEWMNIRGGSLAVGPWTVEAVRDLDVRDGGVLRMDDPAARVIVGGELIVNAAAMTGGTLTAGTLEIRDGIYLDGAPGEMVASGAHLTEFSSDPGSSNNWDGTPQDPLAEVRITAGSEVWANGTPTVSGDLLIEGSLLVRAGDTVQVAGAVSVLAGAQLQVDGVLTAGGGCAVDAQATVTGSGSSDCAVSQFTRTWVGGGEFSPNSWGVGDNWQPFGVPGPSDRVLIPAAAQNQPVLTSSSGVEAILVEVGATVDLNQNLLSVGADLEAPGQIVNGLVVVNPGGGLLEGNVDRLVLGGDATPTGQLVTTGNLEPEGDFFVTDHPVYVGGDMLLDDPASRLLMLTVAGSLDIEGNLVMDGASTAGVLTEGTISVGGDITVGASVNMNAFYANANHGVILDGTAAQTISIAPGAFSQFQSLWIQNTAAPVTMTGGDLTVTGQLVLDAGSSLDGGTQDLFVGGGITDNGAMLTFPAIHLTGDVSVMPAALTTNLFVEAAVAYPNDLVLTGALTVSGGALTVGTNTLTVSGAFATSGAGSLTMTDLAGVLDVGGNVTFDGQPSNLQQGTLRVGGSTFTVGTTQSPNAFAAGPGHLTELIGTTNVSIANVGRTGNHFGDVTVVAGGTTSSLTNFSATGMVTVEDNAVLTGTAIELEVGQGLDVQGTGFVDYGILRLIGQVTVLPTALGVLEVEAPELTVMLPAAGAYTSSDVTVLDGTLGLGGQRLAIPGGFTTTGAGALQMNSASDTLLVAGDVSFGGGSTDGLLTSGVILASGDFAASGSATSFAASGGHLVVLDGSVQQTLSFTNPGPTLQRFQNLTLQNFSSPPGVVAVTDFAVAGVFDVGGTEADAGLQTVFIGTGMIDSDGLFNAGAVEVFGTVNPGQFPTQINADLLVGGELILGGGVGVSGDLVVLGGRVVTASGFTNVAGTLHVSGPGARFEMTMGNTNVTVAGDVVFDGGSHVGVLTDGVLSIGGNFTATGSDSQSFAPSLNHQTVFTSASPQFVTFANPGPGGQRFHHLVPSVGNQVTFATDAYVTGTFFATSGATFSGQNGAVFDVTGPTGILNGNGITFDNLPFRLTSDLDARNHTANNWTLQNMDPAATQVTIEIPGFDPDFPLNLDGWTFGTLPTQGVGLYGSATATNSADLTVNFSNVVIDVDPDGTSYEFTGNANTFINWF